MKASTSLLTLALCFAVSTATSSAALVQIDFDPLPAVGGLVVDENGDGFADYVEPGDCRLGTFTIYDLRAPLPRPDTKIDVTDFFLGTRSAGHEFIGFNMRVENIPDRVAVINGFFAPRLEITALIPEPATTGLTAIGLLAPALRRGRCQITSSPILA